MTKFDVRKRNSGTERQRVPDWIRDFRCQGWTNVFDLLPDEEHLYGTETLFGDWNSSILLLAKDWGSTSVLEEAIRDGEPRPWRHAGPDDGFGWRTNRRLLDFAAMIPGDKLYGSAAASMLFDAPGASRELKGFYTDPLQTFLLNVLRWVLGTMPHVEWVACLGKEAWFLTCITLSNSVAANQFRQYRDSYRPLEGVFVNKKITAFPLYHPAALGNAINEMETGWRAFAAAFKSSVKK